MSLILIFNLGTLFPSIALSPPGGGASRGVLGGAFGGLHHRVEDVACYQYKEAWHAGGVVTHSVLATVWYFLSSSLQRRMMNLRRVLASLCMSEPGSLKW